MKGIVYFDFCNTLVNFETANEFVRYVISREGSNSRLAEILRETLTTFHLRNLVNIFSRSMSINKKLWLYQLKGLNKDILEKHAYTFYVEKIKKSLIKPVFHKLLWYKSHDYKVIIVSGGYAQYISLFAKEYAIDYLCTEFSFKENIFEGKIVDNDCMYKEKLYRITDYLVKNGLTENNLYQIAYSDSISDMPMFSLCKEKYVVIKKDIAIPSWVKTINAKVISY